MGFCLLNQVAVAAAHAREWGVERVAVLDWDVHHGNGTEAIFWDDPEVLYVSLHQYGWGFFPGTGAASDRGGPTRGQPPLNIPLEAGTGDDEYLDAFREVALPALSRPRPELVIVSAGFDAHADDPLGVSAPVRPRPSGSWPGELAELQMPLALVLKGGYDLAALRAGVGATLGRSAAAEVGQALGEGGVLAVVDRDLDHRGDVGGECPLGAWVPAPPA